MKNSMILSLACLVFGLQASAGTGRLLSPSEESIVLTALSTEYPTMVVDAQTLENCIIANYGEAGGASKFVVECMIDSRLNGEELKGEVAFDVIEMQGYNIKSVAFKSLTRR